MIALNTTNIQNNNHNSFFCYQPINRITLIAKSALIQLAAAYSLHIVFYAVVGSQGISSSVVLMSNCLAILLLAGVVKIIVHKILSNTVKQGPFEEILARSARFSIVNLLSTKLNNFIHECGHASAAILTYIKANPRVTVLWSGGMTSYSISYGQTYIGKVLGDYKPFFIVSAGIFAPILIAMSEFLASYHCDCNNTVLKEALENHALSQIFQTVIYGLSALNWDKRDVAHDFIKLWMEYNIHPLLVVSMILAIPLLEKAFLIYLEKKTDELKPQQLLQ